MFKHATLVMTSPNYKLNEDLLENSNSDDYKYPISIALAPMQVRSMVLHFAAYDFSKFQITGVLIL